jgi:hypothetical protein
LADFGSRGRPDVRHRMPGGHVKLPDGRYRGRFRFLLHGLIRNLDPCAGITSDG